MIKTAILVDGGYYKKRVSQYIKEESPKDAANTLYRYCQKHIRFGDREQNFLYRVFYYDCPPSSKKVYNPLTQQEVNLGKSPIYRWNTEFLEELKSKRKFAIRLGSLVEEQAVYNLIPEVTKKLLNGKMKIEDLSEEDLFLSIRQKGIDMRIAMDIVYMALKQQVDKIVLIAGDSDFVPAAKLARREGIDFVLDPMGAIIKPELYENIDGLKSFPLRSKESFNEDFQTPWNNPNPSNFY